MFENHLLPKYYSSPKSKKNLSFFFSQWADHQNTMDTFSLSSPMLSPDSFWGHLLKWPWKWTPQLLLLCCYQREKWTKWCSSREMRKHTHAKHLLQIKLQARIQLSFFKAPTQTKNICYPSTKLKMYSQLKKLADVNTSSQHSTKFLKPWIERVFLSKKSAFDI